MFTVCVCIADMDSTQNDETKLSTSVQTEVLSSSSDDDDVAQPPYHHVDRVTSRSQTDRAAADEGRPPGPGSHDRRPPVDAASRQAGQPQQQPRSTTKCRVIPIVVSGQSTARLGQLCYETTDNTSGPRQ